MPSAWAIFKVIITIFLITLLLSLIHLTLTAPSVVNFCKQVYEGVKGFSPEMAELLRETYIVARDLTGYVYQAYKTVIDWLYEHIAQK